jgi:hypothetical protein
VRRVFNVTETVYSQSALRYCQVSTIAVIKIYGHLNVSVGGFLIQDGYDFSGLLNCKGTSIGWNSKYQKKNLWDIYRFHWVESTSLLNVAHLLLAEYKESKTGYGPLYMNPMEVAIRIINLRRTAFYRDLQKKLAEDARWILCNLEISFDKTFQRYAYNHHLFSLCGLHSHYQSWWSKYLLKRELRLQFKGNHIEDSSCYNDFLIKCIAIVLPKCLSELKLICGYFGDNDSGDYTLIKDGQEKAFIENEVYGRFVCLQDNKFRFVSKTGQFGLSPHAHNDDHSFNLFVNNEAFVFNGCSFDYTNLDRRKTERNGLFKSGPKFRTQPNLNRFDKSIPHLSSNIPSLIPGESLEIQDFVLGIRRNVHISDNFIEIVDEFSDYTQYSLLLSNKFKAIAPDRFLENDLGVTLEISMNPSVYLSKERFMISRNYMNEERALRLETGALKKIQIRLYYNEN